MDSVTIIGTFVVGGSAVIALFFTVGKPIINLNTTLVKLNSSVNNLSEKYEELKEDTQNDINRLATRNSESHERMFEKLDNHESRIVKLEK